MRPSFLFVVALSCALAGPAALAQVASPGADGRPPPQSAQRDLTAPFHTRSLWRLVVTEGPPVKDYGDNDAPGALSLCLHRGPKGPCIADPVTPPKWGSADDDASTWAPHYLLDTRVVNPRGPGQPPFLLIVTGSVYSGDGDQVVYIQLLAYDEVHDAFRRIYARGTGHNNNQEIRFIADGPLRGDVITVEPQDRRPFNYWITVEQLQADDTYRKVLRFLSATHYGDGNPMAVIDSEMPGILEHLGLWKRGDPLPVPAGKACAKPVLRHAELWCE